MWDAEESFDFGYEACITGCTYNSEDCCPSAYARGWDAALDDMLTKAENSAKGSY